MKCSGFPVGFGILGMYTAIHKGYLQEQNHLGDLRMDR
jgi:hypothetical protein